MAAVLKKKNKTNKTLEFLPFFLDFFMSGKLVFKFFFKNLTPCDKPTKSPLACWSLLLVNYSEQSQEAKLTETSLCQLEILFQ